MQSYRVHYMNKYPGGRVVSSASAMDVYDKDGVHVVSLERDASGLVDRSKQNGARDCHDLSPIPKDSRVHKVVDGSIVEDDLAADRKQLRSQFMEGSKVLSCADLQKAKKFIFDEKQRVEKDLRPKELPQP